MRDYRFCELKETSFEGKLLEKTDKALIANFNKVARWIKEHCPNLNGKFEINHNLYHWLTLVVENGKAYLERGSHGYKFDLALSETETAMMVTGSCQRRPEAYEGIQFFRNEELEKFLREWKTTIKVRVIAKSETQSYVHSNDFEP